MSETQKEALAVQLDSEFEIEVELSNEEKLTTTLNCCPDEIASVEVCSIS